MSRLLSVRRFEIRRMTRHHFLRSVMITFLFLIRIVDGVTLMSISVLFAVNLAARIFDVERGDLVSSATSRIVSDPIVKRAHLNSLQWCTCLCF